MIYTWLLSLALTNNSATEPMKGCSISGQVIASSNDSLLFEYVGGNGGMIITESGFIRLEFYGSGGECEFYPEFSVFLNDSLIGITDDEFTITRPGEYLVDYIWYDELRFTVITIPDPIIPHDPVIIQSSGNNLISNIYSTVDQSHYTYFIYDMEGKFLQEGDGVLNQGDNLIHISIANYATGNYFIKLIYENKTGAYQFFKN